MGRHEGQLQEMRGATGMLYNYVKSGLLDSALSTKGIQIGSTKRP